jgi:hypothetical protein
MCGKPLFARPCPTKPRHGFLESVKVDSKAELVQLLKKAQELDADAELMLQPFRGTMKGSFILTPTTLTLGPGHDGATSGRDTVTLRLAPGTHLVNDYTCKIAGIDAGEAGYIEGVGVDSPTLVQLRGGPQLAGTVDYIPPKGVTVKHIHQVKSTDDLLAWEEEVTKLAPGTVVWHPGGSVACHFGVHCVINEVAYVTSSKPEIGQRLVATDVQTINTEAVRNGIAIGMHDVTTAWKHALNFACFALHNFSVERNEKGSYLIGVSAAYFYKLLTAMCLGEFRHRANRAHKDTWLDSVTDYREDHSFIQTDDRNAIYALVWHKPGDYRAGLLEASRSYLGEKWCQGYGGPMWGMCSVAALRLANALIAVNERPTQRRVKQLITEVNNVVNLAHNNGWVFNKIATSTFDSAASGNRHFLLGLLPILYKTLRAKPITKRPFDDATPTKLTICLKPAMWVRAVFAREIKDAEHEAWELEQLQSQLFYNYNQFTELAVIALAYGLAPMTYCSVYNHSWHAYNGDSHVLDYKGKSHPLRYIIEKGSKGELTWGNWETRL